MAESGTVTVTVEAADVSLTIDVFDNETGDRPQRLEIEVPEANLVDTVPADSAYTNAVDGTLGTYTIIVRDRAHRGPSRYGRYEQSFDRASGESINIDVYLDYAAASGTTPF